VPGVAGGAAGGPIIVGPDGVVKVDVAAGGRLISPGLGNVMVDNGVELDAHEEHSPDAT
jgi:hypothetical protein